MTRVFARPDQPNEDAARPALETVMAWPWVWRLLRAMERFRLPASSFAAILVFLSWAGFPASSAAQFSIKSVKWGFTPAGGFRIGGADPRVSEGLVRQGVTNPIVVEWEGAPTDGEMVVELIQLDDLGRQIRKKLPGSNHAAGSNHATGSNHAARGSLPTLIQLNPSLTVRLVHKSGSGERVVAETTVLPAVVPANRPLALCLGAVPEGLAKALMPEEPASEAAKTPVKGGAKASAVNNARLASLGVIGSLAGLPTEAAAYESVDLIWVPMGIDSLGNDLAKADAAQLKALAAWLAQGGRMVLAASPLEGKLAQLDQAMAKAWGASWIDARPGASEKLSEPKRLDRLYRWLDTRKPFEAMQVERIQHWTPGPTAMPLAVESGSEASPRSITPLVESPSGQGAVLLCGFALEGKPLEGWRGESDFYRRTLQWAGALRSVVRTGDTEAISDPFAAGMAQLLGTFPGVILFSFGWILLAILLYMLVIGPLDYWIVDRKFKRPDLTWFTFPAVALLIALAIPWLVGATKGQDLRINRVDLIEYDLASPRPQVSGMSWLSLFTPTEGRRTVEASPNEAWLGASSASAAKALPAQAKVLPWSGSFSGPIFTGGGSAYVDLVEDAAGSLHPEGIPMRVNTDQAFQSTWQAGLERSQAPLLAEVRHPRGNPNQLVGNLTNRLPVAIESPILAYRGRFYPLESNLLPGESAILDELKLGGGGQPLDFWTNAGVLAANKADLVKPVGASREARETVDRHQLIKSLLLGERRHVGVLGGWNLRWRVFSPWDDIPSAGRNAPLSFPRDELILFGRTPLVLGNAATDLKAGPTRFTLDGQAEPAGRILRETYIVAILPVAPYVPNTPAMTPTSIPSTPLSGAKP